MNKKIVAKRPTSTDGRPAGIGDNEVAAGSTADSRELHLFRSLDADNDEYVRRRELLDALESIGLRTDDARLTESMRALDTFAAQKAPEPEIPQGNFCQAIRPNILLIERALQGNMVIPDFAAFCAEIEEIYKASRKNRAGKAANYIPQLDLKDPELDSFGLALCTIDGQRHAIGDAQRYFSVQSTCKPTLYALALEEHGDEKVHQHVGHEPSGASFDELTLNKKGRPHNPLINAGAIISSSLIGQTEKAAARAGGAELDQRGWEGRRLEFVMETWRRLSGGAEPRFNSPVYLSERQTADRNFALAYFMREKGAFPSDVELEDVLDFYFQNCSVELTVEMMSVVAATLANGGICPVTGERVFAPDTVQRVLSLMSTCGMYDYSGEFAFRIGLPAKSGVSGAIMVVVPNVMGFCTWSPRLDELGNSVRGIDFFQRLVDVYNFHNFDNLSGITAKKDPRLDRIAQKARMVNELIWAASKGDLGMLQQQTWRGAELNPPDYDMRTPLHLAAAEGQAEVVRYFIGRQQEGDSSIDMNPRDRWGGTPLNDAYRHGHMEVVGLLEANGGLQGDETAEAGGVTPTPSDASAPDISASSEMIWAASAGDLRAVRRLVARGVPLGIPDYDARTPLHLAAAEGHLDVVTYLLTQGVDANCQDRWGHTPQDDARRHSRKQVVAALERHADKRATIRDSKKPLVAGRSE